MKTLLLIRHAKSSWDFPHLSDFNRPLHKRGIRNATEMAFRLQEKRIAIDGFVSSPANRAITTAKLFAATLGMDESLIATIPELYDAEPDVFPKIIRSLDNRFQVVAIFAHNPGITDFANSLGLFAIDNLPTCGIFSVEISTNDWADFESAPKKLASIDSPKNKSLD
jgi:phosphohistidine phosphatase